jgi:2-desacetyl-2-hydroxyethyl bacteriochlorophyllide A dehydrogenase
MAEARAFWIAAPGRGELRSEPLGPPAAGEVLVETRASGISRGTETLVFRGEVPPSQYQLMRAPFQSGELALPAKYGYSAVGVVAAGAPELLGRRVFCLHPHQDRFVVPTAAVVPVPDAVPDTRAVLAANLETALTGLWDAAPRLGDRAAVIGAGVVGALAAALLARLPGTAVQLIDVDPAKARIAAALGVEFALPDAAQGELDLVIHASGAPAGLARALELAGFEATIVELSWYGARPVALPLGEAFRSRRLRLISSQVGAVAPARRARWSHRRRAEAAVQLLALPALDALVAEEIAFEDAPRELPKLLGPDAPGLAPVIRYPQA